MMTPDSHLYLIDFGIARHFKPGQAKDTIAFGSPGYAAPEQYGKAQTTARSDIYSLGATLHQMLTGIDPSQTPFQFTSLQQQGQPAPPSLESLIMQMLEMNESKRPESMITVKQQLQSIDTQHPIGQINAHQARVSTQSGASPSNPPPPTQTRSAGAIQHPVMPKKAGSIYLNKKRYQEALLAYEQAIQLDPNDAVLYNGKGLALSNLNRYGEALIAYEQAIRLNPNNADAYFNKGDALSGLERYEEALAAYEQAIRLDPNNADAHNNKGYILSKLERYEEALTACEQAIRLDSDFVLAYHTQGDVLSGLERYEEALAAYEQAIRLDPDDALAYNGKGNVLDDLNRYEEALVAYEQAIIQDPDYALAYFNKGNVLEHLGRSKEAQQAYKRARQISYSR
jgi:tetratricopeptide (TPR) repeat protein